MAIWYHPRLAQDWPQRSSYIYNGNSYIGKMSFFLIFIELPCDGVFYILISSSKQPPGP